MRGDLAPSFAHRSSAQTLLKCASTPVAGWLIVHVGPRHLVGEQAVYGLVEGSRTRRKVARSLSLVGDALDGVLQLLAPARRFGEDGGRAYAAMLANDGGG